MVDIKDIVKYTNDRLDNITQAMLDKRGLKPTKNTHYDQINALKDDAKEDVYTLIRSRGKNIYAPRLRDLFQQTSSATNSDIDDIIYKVCMELVVEGSKLAGKALQLIKDEIVKIKRNARLKYHIWTFEEIAYRFKDIPMEEEWSPEVIAGNDIPTIANRLWETPERIVHKAIEKTQRQFKRASDTIERGLSQNSDEKGKTTGVRVLGEIKKDFDSFIISTFSKKTVVPALLDRAPDFIPPGPVYEKRRQLYWNLARKFFGESKDIYERFYTLIFRITRDGL